MASIIMHLAVTCELTKRYDFANIDRLKFGAILPDSGKGRLVIYTHLYGEEIRKLMTLIFSSVPMLDRNIVR